MNSPHQHNVPLPPGVPHAPPGEELAPSLGQSMILHLNAHPLEAEALVFFVGPRQRGPARPVAPLSGQRGRRADGPPVHPVAGPLVGH